MRGASVTPQGPDRRRPFVKVLDLLSSGTLIWRLPNGWVFSDLRIQVIGASNRPAITIGTRGVTAVGAMVSTAVSDDSPGSQPLTLMTSVSGYAAGRLDYYGIETSRMDSVLVRDDALTGGDQIQISGVAVWVGRSCA